MLALLFDDQPYSAAADILEPQEKKRSQGVERAHWATMFRNALAEYMNGALDSPTSAAKAADAHLMRLRRQISHTGGQNLPLKLRRSASHEPCSREGVKECAVCYAEGVVRMKNPCRNACWQMDMCYTCSKTHWANEIQARRFFVAPMKCFACQSYIPIDAWRALAGQTLYERFLTNMEKMNSVRCNGCECDNTLLEYSRYATTNSEIETKLYGLSQIAKAKSTQEHFDKFMAALNELNSGNTSAAKAIVDAVWMMVREDEGEFRGLFRLADYGSKSDALVLLCIMDDERRAQVEMAYMRRDDALVVTRCGCVSPVCYNCRYLGWHEGLTCAENRERNVLDDVPVVVASDGTTIEIFTCPGCFVRFEHAGGCSSMRCICGCEYDLYGGTDSDASDFS